MELVSTVPKSNVFCDLWMAYDKMNKKKKKKKKKKEVVFDYWMGCDY